MTDVAVSTMDRFTQEGGILGAVIFALIVLIIVILWGIRWYITSGRQHERDMEIHHSEQYDKRLATEERMADAIQGLGLLIKGRPCMRDDLIGAH